MANAALYQCSLCPKAFTRTFNLRSHLRTHTDERLFVCRVCGKAFTRRNDRETHEKLHSGERAHKCDFCGKRFARASNLKRHIGTHVRKETEKTVGVGEDVQTTRPQTFTEWLFDGRPGVPPPSQFLPQQTDRAVNSLSHQQGRPEIQPAHQLQATAQSSSQSHTAVSLMSSAPPLFEPLASEVNTQRMWPGMRSILAERRLADWADQQQGNGSALTHEAQALGQRNLPPLGQPNIDELSPSEQLGLLKNALQRKGIDLQSVLRGDVSIERSRKRHTRAKSCRLCRLKKLRCSLQFQAGPCGNCARKGRECEPPS